MAETTEKPPKKIAQPAQPEAQPEVQADAKPAQPQTGEPFEVAMLPLQNTTLFPETVVPLAVGRPRSVAAVEAALSTPEKTAGLRHRAGRCGNRRGCDGCRSLRGGHAGNGQTHGAGRRLHAHHRPGHRTHTHSGLEAGRAVPARRRQNSSRRVVPSILKKSKPPSAMCSR